jgi:hypothetical protein
LSDKDISIKILSDTRIRKHYTNENISDNDPLRNINNLNVSVVNGKLQITWIDSSDPHWKCNVLIKAKNYIPTYVFEEKVLDTMYIKNTYAGTPYIDSDVQINTLYCYRIFTEFDDSDDYYSSFKNIIFVYVYDKNDPLTNDDAINADMIILDSNHRFVTDIEITNWNNLVINNTIVDGGIF